MLSGRSHTQIIMILFIWSQDPAKLLYGYWLPNTGCLVGGVGMGGMVTRQGQEGSFWDHRNIHGESWESS